MITLTGNYAADAQTMYVSGRNAKRTGEPRENPASASHPDNPVMWNQGYKSNPALMSTGTAAQYGPVYIHWFAGWDDQNYGWTDRGWMYSILRGDRSPPINYDGSNRSRLFWLRSLYTFGWINAYDDGWNPGRGDPTGMAVGSGLVGPNEAWWEFQQGRADRKGNVANPQDGYKDPAAYGIPRDSSTSMTPPVTPTTSAPTNSMFGGGGANWLNTLFIWQLLKKKKRR